MKYENPIIKGFNPDPSICRVNDDYYLVTSTFEFFPGVPIYHSKNLVDWKLINHCLTRDSQLNLNDSRNSGGIFAPTIRYHDGIFYMITTNTSNKGNFIVTTEDIRGKWSDPKWIDHKGIDPSLFFDNDKVYFCGTSVLDGKQGIALFEINPLTGEKLSKTKIISYGNGGKYPEAPHIYKINDYYYLMIAEGGTEYGHMETIFRSKNIYGPYDSCPDNPILSHKDYMGSPIQATGHADIVQTEKGEWWLVCLGIRNLSNKLLHNLGRETFLAPVKWDEAGWPIVGNRGKIELEMNGELPGKSDNKKSDLIFMDDFKSNVLDKEWTFVRNPNMDKYYLNSEEGYLKLSAGNETLDDNNPTFLGIRQKEFKLEARTKLRVNMLNENQKAGITAYYNKNYHYEIYITKESGRYFAVLSKKVHDIKTVTSKIEIDYKDSIEFRIKTGIDNYSFSFNSGEGWINLGTAKTAGLCTETTMNMTFTGVFLGVFASNIDASCEYFSINKIK
ncbi:MAG: glycoside hydrolase family 43 protein [Bacillota bacterium]